MNETTLLISISAGIVALLALLIWANKRQIAKRRAAMESVAQQAGWSFDPHDAPVETLGTAPFPLFARGRARLARNVMRASDFTASTMVFDYRYTVGSGKNQTTVEQTVVQIRSPRLSLPPFALEAESVLHKIGELFGARDIDFESNPEFSRRYRLKALADADPVRALFSPVVCAYFEQRADPIVVEGNGDQMLVYRTSKRVEQQDVRAFREEALSIARHLER